MTNKQFAIDMSQCGFVDPQVQLGAALANRDLKSFRAALEMGADPQQADSNHMSVFEHALQSNGCGEFVRECLHAGCNPNYVNKFFKKAAVNYAADSLDPEIVAELLGYQNVQVDRVYEKLTPLNALAKSLNADNVAAVSNCMKQLLHYGASPNIPDQREFTPLLYVLKNRKIDEAKKRELIQLLLEQDDIDLDTYRDGEARQILVEQYEGAWKLPPQRVAGPSGQITLDMLKRHLRSGDEEQFLQDFEQYQSSNKQNNLLKASAPDENVSLLVECIKRGSNAAFDAVRASVPNVNSPAEGKKPIEIAATWGNWYAMQRLLQHEQIQIQPQDQLLTSVVRKLDEKPVFEFTDYQRCFEILLDSEHVDVNESDRSGSTPLHYAVKYRNVDAAKALLRAGAYLGKKSVFRDLPVSDMHPDVLEEHFNDCITTNGLKPGDENFEILMNYMNLMPRQKGTSTTPHPSDDKLHDEMTPIAFLAESKEHRHLLQHPLITSFLFLKWHRLSVVFYINFLFYSLFAVSIIVHTMLKFRESDHQTWTAVFGLLAWIGIVYMILREVIQFFVAPKTYFRSPMNYMEIALIGLSVVTCSEPSYDQETQRVVAVFTILLVALELCLLVGSLPVLSISTHMLMLREVSRSFLKSFTLYSIFVITFSLCFYILFGKPELDKNGEPVPDENGEFNKFSNPVAAVIKTIVMLTGEFDAGDIDFDSLYSYLIFLLFVVFMAIVLFNLLNGLAVSDTQAIKAQAELNGSICRANLLVRYEEVLTGRSDRTNFIVNLEPFRTICRRLMNVYPNYIAGRQIAILPNDANKVLIPIANAYEMRDFSDDRKHNHSTSFQPIVDSDTERQKKPLDPPIACICSCISGKCSRMDGRTVKLALAVLDQKVAKRQEKHRQLNTEKRLQNIEDKLEKMFVLVQQMYAK